MGEAGLQGGSRTRYPMPAVPPPRKIPFVAGHRPPWGSNLLLGNCARLRAARDAARFSLAVSGHYGGPVGSVKSAKSDYLLHAFGLGKMLPAFLLDPLPERKTEGVATARFGRSEISVRVRVACFKGIWHLFSSLADW